MIIMFENVLLVRRDYMLDTPLQGGCGSALEDATPS